MEYLEGMTLKDRLAAGSIDSEHGARRGHPDRRRAGRRAYRGHHPPRHQTRQRLHRIARAGESSRFRPRQDASAGHTPGGRDHDCRHTAGRRDGNCRLHGAGAGPRRDGRSPCRHLELRRGRCTKWSRGRGPRRGSGCASRNLPSWSASSRSAWKRIAVFVISTRPTCGPISSASSADRARRRPIALR